MSISTYPFSPELRHKKQDVRPFVVIAVTRISPCIFSYVVNYWNKINENPYDDKRNGHTIELNR